MRYKAEYQLFARWRACALQPPLQRPADQAVMIAILAIKQLRPEPVTNQVTTAPGSSRRNATGPDAEIPLACDNPTGRDAIG
jgi:hypothetical protein